MRRNTKIEFGLFKCFEFNDTPKEKGRACLWLEIHNVIVSLMDALKSFKQPSYRV